MPKTMFIKKATENKGGLHRALGVPLDQTIPKSTIRAAAANPARFKKSKAAQIRLRRQANLALTLEKLRPNK
jgi:hypothetical protein